MNKILVGDLAHTKLDLKFPNMDKILDYIHYIILKNIQISALLAPRKLQHVKQCYLGF
jgi:hypothetical protein